MVEVPGDAPPVTNPEEATTDATEGLLLVHVPPDDALDSASVLPVHTEEAAPAMGLGEA